MIDNELIRQKNVILQLVNQESFVKAKDFLDFVTPLWESCGYGYKVKEIKERILKGIKEKISGFSHHKTVEKWEKMLASLRLNDAS